jgi:DNA-binding transcriptional regulator/RsmH inhibitor MraZ
MKTKNKQAGIHVMAIDRQRRLCLSARIREEFGARSSQYVYLTLDYHNKLFAFLTLEAMQQYARAVVEKWPVPTTDSEYVLFSVKVREKVDQRGRIAIPEYMLKKSGLVDCADVITWPGRLEIMSPDEKVARREEIISRLLAFENSQRGGAL